MGLIFRSKRGAKKNTRAREPRKTSAPSNRNRRQRPQKRKISFSFAWLGGALRWTSACALALGVAGLISFCLLYGFRYVTNSNYFAVKTLEVTGNFRLTSREVLELAGLHEGMNSLLVSIDAVERALRKNPWIKTVSVKRALPGGFVVGITEREPRFWVRRKGVLHYADAVGEPIVKVSPGKFASLPTLEVEPGAEDLTTRLPELLTGLAKTRLAVNVAAVTRVKLSPGRGVEVSFEKDRLVLSIGREEWRDNLNRLTATLADVTRRGELKDVREVRAHGAGVWVVKNKPVAAG